MKKICVVGSLNMDLTCNVLNLPLKGETILADDMKVFCGGKGANQAYTIGKLGGCVVMLGCVGKDTYGDIILENLKSVDVDISKIKRVNTSTGLAFINIDKEGNNNIVVSQGANKSCDIEYLKENIETLKACDYILSQLEIPLDAVLFLRDFAIKNNKKFILNPAPMVKDLSLEMVKNTYLLIPNEHELDALIKPVSTFKEKVDLIRGVDNLVVTLGSKGAFYKNIEKEEFYKAFDVKAIDTVAAGDCFCGTLCFGLSKDMKMEEALIFASAASAIAVTRKGAQESIPSLEEVEDFLKNKA